MARRPSIPAPVPTGSTAPVSHCPTGIPAIVPEIPNAGPDQPAFTSADVRRYDATHSPRSFAERAKALTSVSILPISFRTVAQLRPQLGSDLGLPSGTLLCYVEYNGTFRLTHPPGRGDPGIHNGAAEVFDAYTGNLLGSSVGIAGP